MTSYTMTIQGVSSGQDSDVHLTVAAGDDIEGIQMTFAGSTGGLASMTIPSDSFVAILEFATMVMKRQARDMLNNA